MIIRCTDKAKLAASVAFRDRIWDGDVAVHYRIGRRPAQTVRAPSKRRPLGTAEWLGGRELIHEIVKAKVLEVAVEDIGFGVNEAIFYLAGVRDALRRVEAACQRNDSLPAGTESAGSPPLPISKVVPKDRDRPDLEREDTPRHPSTEAAPAQTQRSEEQPHLTGPPSGPGESTVREGGGSDAEQRTSPAPSSSIKDRDDPKQEEPGPDLSGTRPRGAAAIPPVPAPSAPKQEDQEARLAAFLQRHGLNRRGELIYDWYHQCLEHAGIDGKQVWYLSSEELIYLSKGETDQVRLSMLISTTRDFDLPPRRITCYGTARGRELTITRAE